jgi:oligosaccharide repeat unit polymerase
MTDSVLGVGEVRRRRFPGIVGIFLGFSLCLHMAAVVYAGFGDMLPAATSFLVGEFLLGLSILRLTDGAWVFQDIRFFFLVFFFLYGATLPLVVVFGLAGEPRGLAGAALMYGTGMLGFNVVQWWFRQPWRDVPREVFARIRPSFANAALVFLGFAWVAYYGASRGIEFSLSIERMQARFIGTQTWVVSQFFVSGLVMYMIAGWPQLSRRARVLLVVSVAAFILLQLYLGNRREFLAMLIFLAGVVATRRHAVVRVGTVILGAITFAVLTLFGVARQLIETPWLLAGNLTDMLVTQNEFVSPIQTLIFYVTTTRPLRLGWTYLSAPSLFIPRIVWPGKPESLSLQFMRDAFGTVEMMGYAYTPVTEAFLNFGWVGPFLCIALVSIALVKLVKRADAHPGLYFVCLSLVVDFNRGDFGGTLYSLIVIGTAYQVMSLLSRLRWAPGRWRSSWQPPLEPVSADAPSPG